MAHATSSSRHVSEPRGPGGSLLLVEDDRVLAEILARYLDIGPVSEADESIDPGTL